MGAATVVLHFDTELSKKRILWIDVTFHTKNDWYTLGCLDIYFGKCNTNNVDFDSHLGGGNMDFKK